MVSMANDHTYQWGPFFFRLGGGRQAFAINIFFL